MQQLINIQEIKTLEEDFEEKLLKSENDYINGRVRKAEDVFKEWKAKYEI